MNLDKTGVEEFLNHFENVIPEMRKAKKWSLTWNEKLIIERANYEITGMRTMNKTCPSCVWEALQDILRHTEDDYELRKLVASNLKEVKSFQVNFDLDFLKSQEPEPEGPEPEGPATKLEESAIYESLSSAELKLKIKLLPGKVKVPRNATKKELIKILTENT